MLLLPLLLAAGAAHAEDRTPVLVSSFQARNAESEEIASAIEAAVAKQLKRHEGLEVLRVEDSPEFEDYSARVYMESCPSGETVGCTFVVGERAHATWAVTGSVQALAQGTRVDVDIVDVDGSRVAVSFRSDLEEGGDKAFAEGVARLLESAIAGEVGKVEDIRHTGKEETEEKPRTKEEEARIAAELKAVSDELGGFTASFKRSNVAIERPKLTESDIAERSTQEGSKPWERLQMTPGEYLHYKNSGLDLVTWRARSEGRRMQVIVRAGGGFINGPIDGQYYGRYILDGVQTVDAYSAQAITSGSGAYGTLSIGFGVHPLIDVAFQAGLAGGHFNYLISQEVVDQPVQFDPVEEQQTSVLLGPRVTVALLPTSTFRPTFGAGAYWMRGSGIAEHILPPDELAQFDAQYTWNVEVFGGGEVRLGDHLDLYAQVPVSFLVGGDRLAEEAYGGGILSGIQTPTPATAVGVAVNLGVQVRFGGSKPKALSVLDETDEP